ncbi:ABC-type transporter, integral membrane subunit [Deinococcus proteolyticus MRP]|uniref:ABC-type transporter, integral membrane subunit n=1 Tax=Deinococcus proteolyticus (strain ATCC 35074 / DSM 20540 / JCM 6276 / NBRC 101906 / NCIMB 13154 / VKM Ac-1939 / CCM 2703 / MRP) TaxID=693977 RepID=F0RJJ8_DEIPM|nr:MULTISPECIES: ABC transporter permease [Deinococcus]ADY26568.1 ABC-type transporter, integral membrane subunit [Deinococcus proteolyticus MRP]MCY1702692.1 ABC transporter permease [Deinococcus sp. SL84]
MTTALPQDIATLKKKSRFQELWQGKPMRKLRRNKLAVIGLIITLLFGLIALFAPLIAPPKFNCARDLGMTEESQIYNPASPVMWKAMLAPPRTCYQTQRISFAQAPQPPSAKAPFGTVNGYNIFHGMIWGTRLVFKLAFIIVGINVILGIIVGAISGFFGGWVDNLIQRFIDVIFSLPDLVLTIVILTILRAQNPGGDPTIPIIIAYVITGWAGYSTYVRADVLKTRRLEYVDAARALGGSDARLIFKHVVPNSVATLLTLAVMSLATVPLGIAALSFLGLGYPVGYTEWGQMINFARPWLKPEFWYVLIYPAAFIVLFSLAVNLFGDALRDAFDPRTR